MRYERDPRARAAARRAARKHGSTCLEYRVVIFDRPRGPWRASLDHAMQDAIAEKLASYDASRREHFLSAPVDIATRKARDGRP